MNANVTATVWSRGAEIRRSDVDYTRAIQTVEFRVGHRGDTTVLAAHVQ